MRTFGKLREVIKKRYKTFGVFADALGMDRSTMSSRLNGTSAWKSTEIEEICKLLDIPMASVGDYFFYD